VTLVTLPWAAVTLMPCEGSALWLPFDGVIFSSAASFAARAAAAADAADCALAWPVLAGWACPPHAAASRPMAAAAAMVATGRTRRPRLADPRLCPARLTLPLTDTDLACRRPRRPGGYRPLGYIVRVPLRRGCRPVAAQASASTVRKMIRYSGQLPTLSASVR